MGSRGDTKKVNVYRSFDSDMGSVGLGDQLEAKIYPIATILCSLH